MAALSHGLAFVPLTTERYDLAMPSSVWHSEPIQRLADWLRTPEARQVIFNLGGYATEATGQVTWVG